ncbi:hypothetical protein ACFC18_50440, partial [Streptomyces sp. NPDC056121]
SGPFAGHDLLTNMITLQAFNGSSALTALLVAAAVSERNQSQQEISRACGYLAEMVAKVSEGGHERMLPVRAGEMYRVSEVRKVRGEGVEASEADGGDGEASRGDGGDGEAVRVGEGDGEAGKVDEEDGREEHGGRTGRTA